MVPHSLTADQSVAAASGEYFGFLFILPDDTWRLLSDTSQS